MDTRDAGAARALDDVAGADVAPPVLNYATADTGRLVMIARFDSAPEASLAQGLLAAEGIHCQHSDLLAVYMTHQLGAVLAVSVEDVGRAIEVLRQTPARRNLLVGDVGGGLDLGLLRPRCPRCASAEVRSGRLYPFVAGAVLVVFTMVLGWSGLAYGLLVALVLSLIWQSQLHCRECGHRWREEAPAEDRWEEDQPPELSRLAESGSADDH